MAKKEMAMWVRPTSTWVNTKMVKAILSVEVRVMVRAEGYAMVRRRGCAPFVVAEKELQPLK